MTLGAARVIYSINDLSLYVDTMMQGYVIAIVQTQRGPVWEPTPVASWTEFERIFGLCYSGSVDPLVLKTGLLQGAKFVVIRIVDCDDVSSPDTITAKKSTYTMGDRADVPTPASIESLAGPFTFTATTPATVKGLEVGPFTFGAGTADAVCIAVGTGADQSFVLTGSLQTQFAVADQINAATSGLTVEVTADGKINLVANNITDTITVKAVANDAYSVLGWGEGVFSPVIGTDKFVIEVNEGSPQTFNLLSGTRTASEVAAMLAGLVGAVATAYHGKLIITTTTTGTGASLRVNESTTAVMGFDYELVRGFVGTKQPTLTFTAKNPGIWGNSLKIYVHESDLHPDTLFDVRVVYTIQSALNEYYTDVSMDPDSDRYVVNYIGERSRLVDVVDEDSPNAAPGNRPVIDDIGTFMAGGDDGEPLDREDYMGDEFSQNGIYACDKTDLAMDIIIPGTNDITVQQALAAFCELRGEFVGYTGFPAGFDPEDARKYRMGELPYTHEPFNSHRLVFFYGRPLVYDSATDSKRLVSNLGMFGSCITKTDTYKNQSYAPVGPRRGTVDLVEGIDWNLADYKGYQDMFAENGINSLIINRQKGIEGGMFWEQYTSQRAASALRDLNVVRFLTMMRRVLMPVLRTFLFEPNHPVTWREVHRTLEPAFELWKAQYCIYEYVLQTDRDAYFQNGLLKNAVLNSGLEIDQGIYRARALVQPTRAIRYIEFEVGVMRTGEAFSTYTEMKELPGWVRN